jgi:hypothetical protein
VKERLFPLWIPKEKDPEPDGVEQDREDVPHYGRDEGVGSDACFAKLQALSAQDSPVAVDRWPVKNFTRSYKRRPVPHLHKKKVPKSSGGVLIQRNTTLTKFFIAFSKLLQHPLSKPPFASLSRANSSLKTRMGGKRQTTANAMPIHKKAASPWENWLGKRRPWPMWSSIAH